MPRCARERRVNSDPSQRAQEDRALFQRATATGDGVPDERRAPS
jgi:hypothetical protein